MSLAQKNRLIELATCTAVFAIVFGLIVSCTGGGSSPLNRITGGARILSHLSSATAAFPASGAHAPLIAAAYLTTQQQASDIQQSFQGLSCDSFIPGTKVNSSGANTGFIPIQVLGDPWIIDPDSRSPWGFYPYPVCEGVFAQIGGGTSLIPPLPPPAPPVVGSGTLTNPGTAIYADGTLSTLIVSGISVAGKQIRCSDLTHTAAVHDSDLVQPYFVIDTNSVVLGVGSTPLPLTCQLNIDPGDEAGSIAVQWAKI
jgi:hypothetical protein